MNKSMAWWTACLPLSSGRAGRCGLRNDQWSILGFSTTSSAGGVAPSSIQAFNNASSFELSPGPSGGILLIASSEPVIALISRLAAALPRRTAGPRSPPSRSVVAVSKRSPASCFCGPWHLTQWAARMGLICRAKSIWATAARPLTEHNSRQFSASVIQFQRSIGFPDLVTVSTSSLKFRCCKYD